MLIRNTSNDMVIQAPDRCAVFIDFDGTMTTHDVLDELIRKYAPAEVWDEMEALWAAGKIGSYECLSRELSAVRIRPEEFAEFINHVSVDPGMCELFRFLENHGIPVTVLSDGIESIIYSVLQNHGIQNVRVRANRACHAGQQLDMHYPWRSSLCQSGSAHCKCGSLTQLRHDRTVIYIGDGRSDLCVSQQVDICFAKDALAQLLNDQQKRFVPFSQLGDVQRVLSQAWSSCAMVLQ